MRESPPTTAPGSQTLARGLNALQLVADAPAGLTVQQVADGIGVHRTIAYRLLARWPSSGSSPRVKTAATGRPRAWRFSVRRSTAMCAS